MAAPGEGIALAEPGLALMRATAAWGADSTRRQKESRLARLLLMGPRPGGARQAETVRLRLRRLKSAPR
eukprot:3397326-Alexandrium_andersonii.AAC.1